MMKAAIYARYSSDMQRPQSIDDQVRVCRELADRLGLDVVAVFMDTATSGSSKILRHGLQDLLASVRAGQVDVVLAEALDRISRDMEDVAALYKQIQFRGAAIHTVSEGRITELHVGLNGTMNALFLKQLAEKTHRGLKGRVVEGKSGGGRCYGYRITAGQTGEREVVEAEAEIVRRIFHAYAHGTSPRAIAMALNADGIPGPRGKGWDQSTINGNRHRGTGILNNELYIGRLVWNRQKFLRDPATRKRVARPNDTNAIVATDVPELRIVPPELWETVKARQARCARPTQPDRPHGHHGYWETRRPRHLLSGMIRCGCCGAGMVLVGKTHYGCAAARNKGTCENRRTLRKDVLEETVLDGLRRHLVTPELTREFIAAYQQEVNRLRAASEASRAGTEAELRQVTKAIGNIIEAVKAGLFHPSMKDELDRLEARKAELHGVLEAPPPTPVRFHPNLAALYEAKIAGLVEALNTPDDRAEAADILRGLIEEIRLVPEGEGYAVELTGDLAQLLSFASASDNKKRPDAGASGRSMKLVAGARGLRPVTLFGDPYI